MRFSLIVWVVVFLFAFSAGCNKKNKKEEIKPAETTRTAEQPGENAVKVDAGKVQTAFDMNSEWARIETLAENVDTVALEKIAEEYKFANAIEMLNYIQFAILGGWHLINKPDEKIELEKEYGKEAISVLMDEKNQKKVIDFAQQKKNFSQGGGGKKGR